MSVFQDLGKALRWLRTRQDRKQYEIAEAAGITKAMLSAYETGKQNPSIETLEKILQALGQDLRGLDHALSVNQSDGEADAPRQESTAWHQYQSRSRGGLAPRSNIYDVLDVDRALPADLEFALSQMLAGFHALLRHMFEELKKSRGSRPVPPDDGPEGEDAGGEPGDGGEGE